MVTRVYETRIAAPIDQVWEFHSNLASMQRLTPPQYRLEIVGKDRALFNGALHEFKLVVRGIPIHWKARISGVDEPNGFIDTAEKSPFAFWQHHHKFVAIAGDTVVQDSVMYEVKGGFLKDLLHTVFVDELVDKMFEYRQRTMHTLLDRGEATKSFVVR